MLDSKGHYQQAQHNEQLSEFLNNTPYADWRATCLFYAALHYVQAYFVSRNPPQSYVLHSTRDTAVQSDPHIGRIWNDYRSLKDSTRKARYDGKKPVPADFKNDILKSLGNVKKEIGRYVSIA